MGIEILQVKKTSQLYHLQPIGIGTPSVESLTSYIKRLAEAHSVSPGNLINKEIIPNINKDYLKVKHFLGSKAINMNSMTSDIIEIMIKILEEKTCNYNMKYLTMNTWKEQLAPVDMFRKIHAWCPICYEESLQLKQPIYEQLIWNFSNVEICKKHQVRLVKKCPYCNSEFPSFNMMSRVGYCNNCNSWLGLKKFDNSQISSNNKEQFNWINDNVGQLLVGALMLKETNNLYFSKNLTNIIKIKDLSKKEFANILNISSCTISKWISIGKPKLIEAIALSYKLGCPVYDILTKDIDATKISFNCKNIVVNKQGNNKIDMNKIKKTIDEAIAANKPLSQRKLSVYFGIGKSTIKKHFPEEVEKLKVINEKYSKDCKLAKLKLIKDTMKSLYSRNIFPSRKALSREFGKRTVTNDDERKVWLETLEELGCTSEDYKKYHGRR